MVGNVPFFVARHPPDAQQADRLIRGEDYSGTWTSNGE